MVKKIAAVFGGVLLGLVIAFARAGAFPFWSSNSDSGSPAAQKPEQTEKAKAQAPVNAPEPTLVKVPLPSFAPLVKQVMPTVVNVSVVQTVKSQFSFGPGPGDQGGQSPFALPFGPGDPFEQFRRFFGQIPHEFKQHGLGSGVIVSSDGYILTNNHVVGKATEIHVTLMDKREFTAKVVGTDSKTDIALIKINTKQPLPVAVLGNSDQTNVGDWVIAIGNPFGFTLTVTAGIVSAKGRALGGNYDNFIQTDASINPGNSGGPLFDTHGRVIGINTAIYSSTGSNAGIGFAIPIDLAKDVMEQLKAHGHVIRGWLGVEIQEVTPDLAKSFGLKKPEGALVADVMPNGPAAKAGIKRGDIIVKFDGKVVHSQHELPEIVAQTPIHKEAAVEVIRNGKPLTVQVTVGELKETKVASAEGEEPGSNWGLQVQAITPQIAQQLNLKSDKGVIVRGVQPDSPAADAGIQSGDVVVEVNHKKIDTVDDFLSEAKAAKKNNKPALLLVQRGEATLYTVIKPKG